MGFVCVKSILPRVVKLAGERPPLDDREIALVYPQVVAEILGKKTAQHARALSLHQKVLVVLVPSSAWACQLQFWQTQICAQLNALAGRRAIERIVFKIV